MHRDTILIFALLVMLVAPVALADDARSARPMSELAELIRDSEAGQTVLVPPGIYLGNLVIDKPVVLDGGGNVVLDAEDAGTVVQINSPDVTIRRFLVRNSGKNVTGEPAGISAVAGPVVIEDNTVEDTLFGIDLRGSPGSVVRNNSIRGKDLSDGRRGDGIRLWWSHDCIIEDNTVRRSRDMVFWYSENLRISRNTVIDSRYGLHFMYSHDTVLTENELAGNSVGVYLMYSNRITLTGNRMRNNRGASGYGIGLKDCDDIIITGNALLANRVGVYIDNSPSSVDSTGLFESNMIAFNEIGLLATPNTHDNVFTANAFMENEEPAATNGRGQLTKNTFSLDGVGNYWSSYAGFDLDGDGIGDVAYEPQSLFGAMLSREPNLRLFVHSPAQQAIEFTARALPELLPSAVLIDSAPLAAPPTVVVPVSDEPRSAAVMATLAFTLCGTAVGLVLAFGRDARIPPTNRGAAA